MFRTLSLLLPAILAPALCAQDPAAEPAAPQLTLADGHAALTKACGKMGNLQGVQFSTVESQDDAMTRQFGGMLGKAETEVIGRWSPDTVELEIGDADEIVVHRGRMIARDDDHEWSLRRDKLAGGSDVPFVFDPGIFFESMSRVPKDDLEVTNVEKVALRSKEYLVVSVTIEDDAAHELAYTGSVPTVGGRGMGGMIIGGLPGGMKPAAPSLTTDLAVYIDPDSHLIHRIRVKAYQESPFGGNVVIQVAGGGGADDEEEEDEEIETKDASGKQIYKKGLPLRNVGKGESVLTYNIRFRDHDKPMVPELDDGARKLLRMR